MKKRYLPLFGCGYRTRVLGALVVVALAGCDDDNNNDDDRDNDNGDGERRVLDPAEIPKFTQPLVIPPVMPPVGDDVTATEYRIAAWQFQQQVLPPGLPATTVWGYGREGDPATFNYPGFTVETRRQRPVRVTWVNELVDDRGDFLPHLLPVDSTLHWADPGGQGHGSGAHPRYTGPVPIVTHVHGAHSFDHSDGHPDAWYLPDARNIPAGFARQGPRYQSQREVGNGAAVFDYPLDEAATTLWYHDHSLGITRLNVYAGLAGFWIVRDDNEDRMNLPGPAPRLGEADGTRHFEIPIVIQDRTFAEDGSLWYPAARSDYDGYDGPVIPDSEVPPIWGPEFIGNAMVVNGRAWPFLEVEPRLYRFRLLNGSNARTLILDLGALEIVQIGVDGGLLPDAPVRLDRLTLGPAERADVLVDFSSLAAGETVTMTNVGPDEPWSGPNAGQAAANPSTTGQVMQFRVVEPSPDAPADVGIPVSLPAISSLVPTAPPRDLVLVETQVEGKFPAHVRLGTVALGPLPWSAPASEVIRLDDVEVWRVANTTDDAHPIHLHLVDFQVLDRLPFDADAFSAAQSAWLAGTGPAPVLDDYVIGSALPISPSEAGRKDTAMMLPNMITRIAAHFDREGVYVWHCHVLEHEDHDMMRPLEIVSP